MPFKIVDAVDENGEVAASYPITLNSLNTVVTDEEFIELAKDSHEEDGFSPALVDKWVVREPSPDEKR